MKILVTAKRVVDPYVRIRFSTTGELQVSDLKHSVNPFDEVAIEAAVRLKEEGIASEVVAVTIGTEAAEESLRAALAVGVDRGILVVCDHEAEPLTVARILACLVDREGAGLVILGKQAIDGDSSQVGPMLAGLKGWPQATGVARIDIDGPEIRATCEGDGGAIHVNCRWPAVLTVDLRLNTPRYAALPGIMRARKKPVDRLQLADLPVDVSVHSVIKDIREPAARSATCQMAGSADELARILKQREKVI
jgi:electron transfer flavoprotein beta subunit